MQDASNKQICWLGTKKVGSVLIIKVLVPYINLFKHPPQEYKDLLSAAYQEGHEGVVIDLDKVEFSDSTWGPLDLAIIALKKFSLGRVALCNLHPNIEALLKLCRLDEYLQLRNSEEEAIDAILCKSRDKSEL